LDVSVSSDRFVSGEQVTVRVRAMNPTFDTLSIGRGRCSVVSGFEVTAADGTRVVPYLLACPISAGPPQALRLAPRRLRGSDVHLAWR